MTTVFCFPEMFKVHIKDSNLKLPKDFEKYNREEYPHFYIFIELHCARPININTLKDNANIIASISDEEIKKVTIEQLLKMGLWIENSCDFA